MKDANRKSIRSRGIWAGMLVLCAALGAADALYHKHPKFPVEEMFGFYAIYGFIACVALVLVARVLRWLVERPEDYYGEDDV